MTPTIESNYARPHAVAANDKASKWGSRVTRGASHRARHWTGSRRGRLAAQFQRPNAECITIPGGFLDGAVNFDPMLSWAMCGRLQTLSTTEHGLGGNRRSQVADAVGDIPEFGGACSHSSSRSSLPNSCATVGTGAESFKTRVWERRIEVS
jgi:hypothetical protein